MKENGLKFWIQRRIIAKANKANGRDKIFPTIKSIKKIAIISDSTINKNDIRNLFGIELQIEELKFISSKRSKDDLSPYVFKSDLNSWGIPPKKLIDTFVNTPFDVLIDYTSENSGAIEFVCAKSVAKFKIGKHNANSIYDLIINKPEIDSGSYSKVIVKTLTNFS